MPSYFYHLAIELFARPLSEPGHASCMNDPSSTSLSFDSACEALLPFQKTTRQTRRSHAFSNDKTKGSSSSNLPFRPNTLSSSSNTRNFDTTAPSTVTHHPTTTTNTPPHPHPHIHYTKSHNGATDIEKDQRLDSVSIECIDMIASSEHEQTISTTGPGLSKRVDRRVHFTDNNNPVTTGIGTDILGGLRTKGRYIPLDQKTSDSVWGIVHLYRDAQETPYLSEDDYPLDLKGSSAAARQPGDLGGSNASCLEGDGGGAGHNLQDEEYTTLCILAVPSYMSPSDFLGFMGEKTRDDVSHFRMIRTARANRYMVLMKFRSGKKAKEWQRVWNGKVFNSMEVCYLLPSPFSFSMLTISSLKLAMSSL